MAKADKFKKTSASSKFEQVAKTDNALAQLVTTKTIPIDHLIDFPKNNEDIEHTEDLEASINEQGFIDPIDVTDFGQKDGYYMIVSGHRRRRAAERCGLKFLPCYVRHFDSELAIEEAALFANSHRDSSKDPLLIPKRYIRFKEVLEEKARIGEFKGNIYKEVARNLGLSRAQADRYNAMNRIIVPVWDMVRDEIVGMSNVVNLAPYTPEKQVEIYKIMNECLDSGNKLTRSNMTLIFDKYEKGARTWDEVSQKPDEQAEILKIMQECLASGHRLTPDIVALIGSKYKEGVRSWDEIAPLAKGKQSSTSPKSTKDSGIPLSPLISTEPSGAKSTEKKDRKHEVKRSSDPIADNADKMDADKAQWEADQKNKADLDVIVARAVEGDPSIDESKLCTCDNCGHKKLKKTSFEFDGKLYCSDCALALLYAFSEKGKILIDHADDDDINKVLFQ